MPRDCGGECRCGEAQTIRLTNREGCGFPFFVAKMYARRRVRLRGGALAEKYLDDFADFCSKGVRVVVSGEREGLPQKLVRKIEEMQLKTADFDAICVNLCINYGGRREIAHAAQRAAQSGAVSEQSIAANLYNNLPFPDVIVRTGERFFAHVCRLF